MAILHGSWLLGKTEGSLFIWGETWRKIGAIDLQESKNNPYNPFAMTEAELKTFLASLQQSGQLKWQLPETAETTKKRARSSKTKNTETPPQDLPANKQIRAIALPTHIGEPNSTLMPLHSAAAPDETVKTDEIYLYPWQVEGICLNSQAAFDFLRTSRGGVWIYWRGASFCLL
jgi:hypothetical protein